MNQNGAIDFGIIMHLWRTHFHEATASSVRPGKDGDYPHIYESVQPYIHHFPRCLFSTRCERHNKRPQRMVCYFFLLQCYHMFNCSPYSFSCALTHTLAFSHSYTLLLSHHSNATFCPNELLEWNKIQSESIYCQEYHEFTFFFFVSLTKRYRTQFGRINVKKPKGKSFFRSHKTDSEKERWRNAIEQEKKKINENMIFRDCC